MNFFKQYLVLAHEYTLFIIILLIAFGWLLNIAFNNAVRKTGDEDYPTSEWIGSISLAVIFAIIEIFLLLTLLFSHLH
jgi:hypothetical protein